ncbi:MAG: hypothetical protein V3R90_00260, partial [Limibaculum sp.]
MAKLGKRMKVIREAVQGKSLLPLGEAVALVKSNATAKFDETIELARTRRSPTMREAVLVDMIRTPFGRAGQRGVFRDVSHVEMVVPLMQNVLSRNNVGGEEVDEVLWGSVGIAGMLTRSRHYV